MPSRRRYLDPQVRRDLARKMVFVAGPRQVGKTTLARGLPGAKTGYLSWDIADLQVSHKTVASWLGVLERLYAIFRLPPFGAPRIRVVKKEQKHYHLDWSLVPGEAARFENLVAAHLLKWVHFEQDAQGRDLELRYFRDTDGREVDFVVVEGRRPLLLVECKWADTEPDRSLRYLKARFPAAEAWQLSATGRNDYVTPEGIRIAPALALLGRLV